VSKRLIINGAAGKMGRLADKLLTGHDGFDVVARLGREDNLQQQIKEHAAEIVLDVTSADSVFENSKAIIAAGARPVIGTSGLREEQIDLLDKLCRDKKTGGVVVPNFSIGAVLMMQFAKQAAKYFPQVNIIERHHKQKKDAPSGTAIRTAEIIAANREVKEGVEKFIEMDERSFLCCGVPIQSKRLDGVVAEQEVLFASESESLLIEHKAVSRECFSEGILLACKRVTELDGLVCGLENFLV
jgi:4-hydroxy-tetrahydrodipicolinate reductase